MKKVIVFDFDPTGAVSWYRGCGPWTEIAKRCRGEIDVQFCNFPPSWMEIAAADIIFMPRPYKEEHLNTCKVAEWYGTKIWLDYDDDLFNLTVDNPSKVVYEQDRTKLILRSLISKADILTLSTPRIMHSWKMLKLINAKTKLVIIPNAIDDRAFTVRTAKQPPARKTVIWRGMNSHLMDLEFYAEEILSVAKQNPEVAWLFFGTAPWFSERLKNSSTIRTSELPMFFDAINSISASVAMVPLRDTHFNHCKSNIAAMELCHTGAVCVVPDWEEWQLNGSLKYHDKKSFEEALAKALSICDSPESNRKTMDDFYFRYGLNDQNFVRQSLLKEFVGA